jgi:phage terminase small subunit
MEHKQIRTGSPVSWDWGKGTAKGKVKEIYRQAITKEIKGHKITRQGSESNPAYLIEQEDQTQVLKLKSELNQG